jgi:hypothetical protein
MGAIDRKRCPHCVGFLDAVRIEEHDDFAARGPAVICPRCDGEDPAGDALAVPLTWE